MSGRRRARRLGVLLAAGLVLLPGWRGGAEAQDDAIGAIRIEGNQRIEDSTILSNLTVRAGQQVEPGSPFDPLLLDTALKSLFETGLFADVTLAREGSTLIVRVAENPIVNQVVFEGNQRVEDEDLASETTLRQRTVFTRGRVRTDQERLLTVYRRSGRFGASVVPKVVLLDQNRVNVIFEIDEGPLTGIESINFVGNRRFSDGDLREVMRTRESRWWRFLSSSDRYDPDQLAFDEELLRRHYFDRGYLRFRILSSSAELLPDGDAFLITIAVDEGDRYTPSARPRPPRSCPRWMSSPCRTSSRPRSGDDYSRSAIQENDTASSPDAVVTAGFPFVQVDVEPEVDDEAKTIALHYRLVEGERLYVDRIEIKGNVRTLDHVVRPVPPPVRGGPPEPGAARPLADAGRQPRLLLRRAVRGGAPAAPPISGTSRWPWRSGPPARSASGWATRPAAGRSGTSRCARRNLLGTGSSLTVALENARTGGLVQHRLLRAVLPAPRRVPQHQRLLVQHGPVRHRVPVGTSRGPGSVSASASGSTCGSG